MVIGPVIVRVINKIRGVQPRYLRTAAKDYFAGVTFNANGHYIVKKKKTGGCMAVGLQLR